MCCLWFLPVTTNCIVYDSGEIGLLNVLERFGSMGAVYEYAVQMQTVLYADREEKV